MNILRTYNKYDAQKKRLAIFGREMEGGKIEICVVRCSRHDQFDREVANAVFVAQQCKVATNAHPEVFIIDIAEGDSFHWTFHNWCNKTYYRKVLTTFIGKDEILYSKRIVRNTKMDRRSYYGVEVYKLTKNRKGI